MIDLISSPFWQQFWRGEQPALLITTELQPELERPRQAALLSGSFNPLHEGHRKLAEAAEALLGRSAHFELSVTNVDKPALTAAEVARRLPQFRGYRPVLLTREPTFDGKAAICPGNIFVVGYDTAERILSPRYYNDDAARLQAALEQVAAHHCRFLVACRALRGELRTLADLDPPAEFAHLFTALPPELFRVDISSTELRNKNNL